MDTMRNRISAIYFLNSKMNGLEAEALEEKGIKAGESQEETVLGGRNAAYKSEIAPLEEKGFEDINQVKLTISWQEGSIAKDETLVTYLPNKK